MILVCLLPGGKEKNHNLNHLLAPMVDEFESLWSGVDINVHGERIPRLIRAAIALISCDLPAGRKMCGWRSFNNCCSRCTKPFTVYATERKGSDGKTVFATDKAGTDYAAWTPRDADETRDRAEQWRECQSQDQHRAFCKQHDVKYSILYRLPYFDAVKTLVFDPMHCLWLGIAKHVLDLWKADGFFSESQLAEMQTRVDDLHATRKYGRMRSKIAGNMSDFTAEELKLFTVVYSSWLLQDYLPQEHFEMWVHFADAATILSKPCINESDLQKAQSELVLFGQNFIQLFGRKKWTPNMVSFVPIVILKIKAYVSCLPAIRRSWRHVFMCLALCLSHYRGYSSIWTDVRVPFVCDGTVRYLLYPGRQGQCVAVIVYPQV